MLISKITPELILVEDELRPIVVPEALYSAKNIIRLQIGSIFSIAFSQENKEKLKPLLLHDLSLCFFHKLICLRKQKINAGISIKTPEQINVKINHFT